MKDIWLTVHNIITEINESTSKVKFILLHFKYRCDAKSLMQNKNGIEINVDVNAKNLWNN